MTTGNRLKEVENLFKISKIETGGFKDEKRYSPKDF
jgi:hypothetical protein